MKISILSTVGMEVLKLTKLILPLQAPLINIYILIKIMKKPYIALICTLFPLSVMAANPIDELASSVDSDSEEYANFLANFFDNEPSNTTIGAKSTPSTHEASPKKDGAANKVASVSQSAKSEQEVPLMSDNNSSQAKTYSKPEYGLLISNIPETSELKFNKDVNLLPYKNVAYYMKGQRVYFNPLKNEDGTYRNELVTFCSLNFTDYGIGRRIRSGKSYSITEVGYSKTSQDIAKYGSVNIQKVVMNIDNEHLKAVTCFSTEKNNQFTIGDLMYEVSNIFDIKLRDYVDI